MTEVKENKMGVMPVNKLLLSMSVPIMISMLVQALYNIVDSIFVAKISEEALSAVSYAFPLQTLLIAFGGGTGVGVNALLSRALGEKDHKKANVMAMHGVLLAVVNSIIFLIVGLFLVKPFYLSQTNNENIIKYGVEYLTIVCTFSFGLFSQFLFERLLQSTGKTIYTMITQATGAIINIILDPILIFGMFGLPKMGVAGAAIATVIGQVVAGVLGFIINQKVNKEIRLQLRGFRPSKNVIIQIYKIGIPSIIMQSIGSIMVYGFNKILGRFTDIKETAVAVFGVYYKLQSFIFMPVFGLNNGMVPIIAYNYGARKKDRMLKTMKLSMLYATAIMVIGLIVFQLFPGPLFSMFEASETMLSMGETALKIISIHFIFVGFNIIGTSTFQSLGNAVYSMIISICRQLLVLLPSAYILSLTGNVNNVWFAFPIAEVVACVLTIVFMIVMNKKIFSKI
ncbi:MAG: MATE family efflux transporter [Lachnospiraceae bacterium]|nr:MATE family efflux transporter [Lachnospiraceae bacterium]